MILRKGEVLILKEEKISAGFELTSGEKISKQKGDLFLTNQRIVFEAVGGGLFSKKRITIIDCPLESVANVSIEGFLSKKLVLQLPVKVSSEFQAFYSTPAAFRGEIECRVVFCVKNPAEWQEKIVQAIRE